MYIVHIQVNVYIYVYIIIYIYFYFHQQTRIYLYNKLYAYLNRSLYMYIYILYIYLCPHLIRIYTHLEYTSWHLHISGTYSPFSRGSFYIYIYIPPLFPRFFNLFSRSKLSWVPSIVVFFHNTLVVGWRKKPWILPGLWTPVWLVMKPEDWYLQNCWVFHLPRYTLED